jgi:hypothetical protein
MVGVSDKPNPWRGWGTAALMVPLFAILAASLWFAARAFTAVEGPPMPAVGYVAMTLGVVFSLVVGCGLMALLFYSSRHGYDEPPHTENDGD